MYNDYFGFKEAPFSIAPDPRYLYMTSQHREALAHLVYGLNSEGGCILLTGEVGTGKTTICRCLLEQVPDRANIALVLNPKVNEIELLETICDELHIDYPDAENSIKTYTDRIYQYLIDRNRNDQETVLIIDEAQNLDSKVLEQLRLLTNLETNQRKLLQIIILGQPELLEILARPEMRQLAQRITARFHLEPLDSNEVKAYVDHRLAVAGQNIQLFPDNSIRLIYRLSKGVPRLINILCDRALLGAYVENQYTASPAIVKKAAKEVFGELSNVERHQRQRPARLIVAASLIMITLVATAVYFYGKTPDMDAPSIATPNSIDSTDTLTERDRTRSQDDVTSPHKTVTEHTQELLSGEPAQTVAIGSPAGHTTELQPLSTPPPMEKPSVLPASTADDQHSELATLDEILHDAIDDPATAFRQLFESWGASYDTRTNVNACKQANSFQLSCLHRKGNLTSLMQHNRPAVLTLYSSAGESIQATITSIEGELATLYIDGIPYQIALDDLDRHWHGQYVLLWKKPLQYVSAITPGDQGAVIGWLASQLQKTHKQLSGKVSNSYDPALVDDIKSFQSQQGLTADGIVGPVTIIHLNSRTGMKVPSLTANDALTDSGRG